MIIYEQWWFGLFILLVYIASIALLAINYTWLWYDLLQRTEPFTAQMARIAQAHPLFWYGGVATAIALLFWVIGWLLPFQWMWYLRIMTGIALGFFGWFIWHIYAAACDPDNPPHLNSKWFPCPCWLQRAVRRGV